MEERKEENGTMEIFIIRLFYLVAAAETYLVRRLMNKRKFIQELKAAGSPESKAREEMQKRRFEQRPKEPQTYIDRVPYFHQ